MELNSGNVIVSFSSIFFILCMLQQLYNYGHAQFYLDDKQTDMDGNETDSQGYVNSTEFKNYADEDFGLEIQYPSDWEVETKDLDYALVVFFPPDGDSSVSVKLIPRDKQETLKQFGDKTFKKNDDFRISEYYRNPNTTFAGLPAIKMIGTYYFHPNYFEALKGTESYVAEVLWVISLVENKDAFVGVAYFGDKSNFNEYLPYVEKMINSVKLTTKGPIVQEED